MKKSKSKSIVIFLLILLIILFLVFFWFLAKKKPGLLYRAKLYLHNLVKTEQLEIVENPETARIKFKDLVNDQRTSQNENLILVNQEHQVAESYQPQLVEYKDSGVLMNPSIIEDYSQLSSYISSNFDEPLWVMSSYRSLAEQAELDSNDFSTVPGASEHHTGLALDIYVYQFAGEGFINHEIGRYVNDYADEYGFIIRYPQGAEDITGIPYEPWHIRYVGKPHAQIMKDSGIVLEEYIDSLVPGNFYRYENFIISRQTGDEITVPKDFQRCSISPDNTNYYIFTFELG